jgi:hypothetical protein
MGEASLTVLAEIVEFRGGLCGIGKFVMHELAIAGLDRVPPISSGTVGRKPRNAA